MQISTMAQRVASRFSGRVASLDPFRQKVYDTIHKYWPNATLSVRESKNDTYIVFALWQKSDWPNGIFENDPAAHKMFIWGSHKPNGEVSDQMELDLAMGGTLWGANATRLDKIGFRKAKGDEKKILKALDTYFGKKLKAVVEKHKDALEEKRQRAKTGADMADRVAARVIEAAKGLVVLEEDDYDALSDDEKRRWKGYWYKMTYETWDEEALEIGETDDKGWRETRSDDYDYLDELLNSVRGDASWLHWSDSSPGPRSWINSDSEEDYSSGERTNYSLWIMRGDRQPLSREEIKHITRELHLR